MLDNSFVLITCAYNAEDYIDRCILSAGKQGEDIGHIIIDDCSTDGTYNLIKKYKDKNCLVLRTKKRTRTPGYIQQQIIKRFIKNPDTIVGVLDGDDYLLPGAVKTVRDNIKDNWMFCSNYKYGRNNKVRKSELPNFEEPIRNQGYKLHHFRGFRKHLSDGVNPKDFFLKNKLMGAGSDIVYMYAMLEMAGKDRIIYIDEALYHYNIFNPINDHKVNYTEQYNAFHISKGIDPYDIL
jgi:glycosyltransferase involved in cell wall biosynthesis